jgi:hypothetical protein
MRISILAEPSQVGFRATTGGPLELSAEAASAADAVNLLQEMIAARLERGAVLIDQHVSPPQSPISVLYASGYHGFDSARCFERRRHYRESGSAA